MYYKETTYRESQFPRAATVDIFPILVCACFVATFAIKALTDGLYVSRGINNFYVSLKYLTAIAACFFALPCMNSGSNGKIFLNEFNRLLVLFSVFAFVSIVFASYQGVFSSKVSDELLKFGMPVLLAYCILNALSRKQIYRCMECILIFAIIGYLLELQAKGASVFDLMEADYFASSSRTESSYSAGIAVMLSLFFSYFRDKKWPAIVALMFCILTFKRLALIIAIAAFALSTFAPNIARGTIVEKRIVSAFKVFTLFGVCLYAWLLLPEQADAFYRLFGDTQNSVTMGRSAVFNYLLSSGFVSYGFGSANEIASSVFGMGFEMDLLKIAFELTPIVMVLFIWLFWDIAGNRLWGVIVIGYVMLNLITSDSLSSNFSMALAYIIVGMANYLDTQTVGHEMGKANEC